MQQLRAEWERNNRNLPPLYGVYPYYFVSIDTMADDWRVMKLAG